MALIFPLFMAVALPGIYLAAFHAPVPNHMSVEIIGTGQSAEQLAEGVQIKAGDALDVSTVSSVAAGKHDVNALETRAAYDPGTGRLYVASAGSVFAAQSVESIFGKVAEQTHTTLTVDDLKPLPASDSVGVTLLMMGLGGIMAGFTAATVVNLVARLKLRTELGILAGVAAAAGIVTTFIAYATYGALNQHAIAAGLLVAGGALVTGLVQSGGVKLIGPAMAMPGLLIFLFLGIPASGATVPIDMTPAFFQDLHHVLSTSGTLDGLRRIIYFDSTGIWPDILTLIVWAAIGGGMMWLAGLKGEKAGSPSPLDAVLDTAAAAAPTRDVVTAS